jgi:hypothetical protein
MRVSHATAIAPELETVVSALDHITDLLAQVQRGEAVRTTVAEGDRGAVGLAKQYYRLVEVGPTEKLARYYLVRPGCDVPSIFQHRPSTSARLVPSEA